jgi:RNA polymerase sigma-70 factor (ECF subfamily)
VDLDRQLRDLAPRLARYATAVAGDAEAGADVAQNTLLAVVERVRSGRPPASIDAFAFVVARRRALRSRLRRRLFAPLTVLLETASGGAGPEREALGREGLARALAALERLPRGEREALALVALGELDVATAAATLGISPAALKMRTSRARARLSTLLEDPDGLADVVPRPDPA